MKSRHPRRRHEDRRTRKELLAELNDLRRQLAEERLRVPPILIPCDGSSFDREAPFRDADRSGEDALSDGERLGQLLSLVPVAVYTCDRDGLLTSYNACAMHLWGRAPRLNDPRDRFCGSLRLFHPDGSPLPHDRTPMAAALRDGTSTRGSEVKIERTDGSRVTVSVHIDPIRDRQDRIVGAVNVFEDVTELRNARLMLHESESATRLSFELSAVGQSEIEISDRRIRKVNRKLCEITGYTESELLALTADELTHPADRAADRALFQCHLETGIDQYVSRKRYRCRDGSDRWVEVHAVLLRDPEGRPIRSLTVVQDIHSQVLHEEELRKAGEEAEAVRRMAEAARQEAETASRAKSEFLAHMSHELRTPISGIMGMLDLLHSRMSDEESRTYLDMIRDSARTLLSLIGDILDLGKIEAGKAELIPHPFSIHEEAEQLISSFHHASGRKSLQLSLEIDPEVPEILRGDAEKLGQVLRNLIGNAVKYTEQGGITVRIEREETAEREDTVRDRCFLRFTVTDTGIGIPADRQHLLFESFSRPGGVLLRNRSEGTGLGLAISRRLVVLLGGRGIDLRSDTGSGSTFRFTIPLEMEHEVPSEPDDRFRTLMHRSGRPSTKAPGTLSILLAEDNLINRVFLETTLRDRGHRVCVAEHGLEAVELVRSALLGERESFDLVLMDVQMPVMDGIEATGRIRSMKGSESRIPIVALTAFAMKGDRERLLEAGMDEYVTKPVAPEQLDRVMRSVLRERIGAGTGS